MPNQNLEELNLTIKKDLSNSKKKVQRLKVKAIVKIVATSVILVGGVVSTILFPNPISGAIAIGAATVLSGSEGVRHTVKRLKSVKVNEKVIKKANKETEDLLFFDRIKTSVNEKPSAPPMYPNMVA